MYPKLKAKYVARSKIIKAIAHPSRLFIIEELNKGKRCVNELTDMIGSDTSTVSKHLSVLKHAGLILDEKNGANIYYTLRTPCILDFIGCIENVIENNVKDQFEMVMSCRND